MTAIPIVDLNAEIYRAFGAIADLDQDALLAEAVRGVQAGYAAQPERVEHGGILDTAVQALVDANDTDPRDLQELVDQALINLVALSLDLPKEPVPVLSGQLITECWYVAGEFIG